MRISIFSGGRGSRNLYVGLRELFKSNNQEVEIALITNAYDDGMSTGVVRSLIPGGILGPSDVRKLQENQFNYFNNNPSIKDFFGIRFEKHSRQTVEDLKNYSLKKQSNSKLAKILNPLPKDLRDLNIECLKYLFQNTQIDKVKFNNFSYSNLIYAALAGMHGNDLQNAEIVIRQILNLKDVVLLNSSENKYLFALTEDGGFLRDEASIVGYLKKSPIYSIYLSDKPISNNIVKQVNGRRTFLQKKNFIEQDICSEFPDLTSECSEQIASSDLIIYSSGTQYSSLYPTFATKSLGSAIKQSSALKVMVTNILPDNETPNFRAIDSLNQACFYLNQKGMLKFKAKDLVDCLLVNEPSQSRSPYIRPGRLELESLDISKVIIDKRFEKKGAGIEAGKHNPSFLSKTIYQMFKSDIVRSSKKIKLLTAGLLAFDLDGTLFSDRRKLLVKGVKGSRLNVDYSNLNLLLEFLESNFKIVVISGNDFDDIQENFCKELILMSKGNEECLKNLSIFANGSTCLYEFNFSCKQFELDASYSNANSIEKKDFPILKKIMGQGLKRLKTQYEADGKKVLSQNYNQTIWNYKKFPTFLKERGDASQLIIKPVPSKLHFKNSYTGNLSYRASLFKYLEDMLKTKKLSAKYSLYKRGWGTIELQKSGINKNKALDFYLKKYQIKKKNVLFFGNEFEEDGNDFSIVENNFNVIGLSNEKSKLPVRPNLFYGGHRGVASTGFHLSYLLEIYEAEVKKIKYQKSNLLVEPLVKSYIKILRKNLLR
jgi:2-phospho-L-lactate transferase/gluconeogenesis factor (CofD/UPF0052 family)/hydroxymethylpyrimidine pyrophosphatase-like HAD family hydrolase